MTAHHPLRFAAWLACAMLACADDANAASITLKSGWMRPAAAGAANVAAWVDISSDTAVELTAISSPVADLIEIVLVETTTSGSTERIVASLPILAARPTRLAYRGDHLRLQRVQRDLRNGEMVPVTMDFRDASGATTQVTSTFTVRGLQRQPSAASAPSPAAATAVTAPALQAPPSP